jgi:uncharacterized membrane protein HdeD (DUF308 family)
MRKNVPFFITLIRGILAVSLGTLLLFQPVKTRSMLANFMGMFWLVSGIFSLRWGAAGERARSWALLAGIIGVVAGVGMLARGMVSSWIAEDIFFSLLGVTVLLTGSLHAFGGFRIGVDAHRKWSLTSFLLGTFEIVLGVLLIVEPLGRSPIFYLSASVWALVGGFILIGDAIRLWRVSRESIQ